MARHKKGALRIGKFYLIKIGEAKPLRCIHVDVKFLPIFYDYKSGSLVEVHPKDIIGEAE